MRRTVPAVELSVPYGVLRRFDSFPSEEVPPRPVYVWLPEGSADARPVLYMHDGDKVFRPADVESGNWGVPETVTQLSRSGDIEAPIVVAISATENRAGEYMPEKPLTLPKADLFFEAHRNRVYIPRAEAYLRFIVNELKPWVDSTYPTKPDRANTAVMGCSRGGLISIYALAEYPQIFGGAACLSTHWPHGDGIVIDWLTDHMPGAGFHRVYFDYGDRGLDAAYAPYQERMDQVMDARGYVSGTDWITRFFPGHGHAENFWRSRLAEPMQFLFGPGPAERGA